MNAVFHRTRDRALLVAAPEPADKPPARLVLSARPKLDYDGPPLDEKTAQMLRERFEPKDPSQTIWF